MSIHNGLAIFLHVGRELAARITVVELILYTLLKKNTFSQDVDMKPDH